MNVSALAIEVTRKCNIKCDHCLRGDMQNIDIDPKYIDLLFNQISSIKHLVFTGGEPTLNVPIIKYVIIELKRRNINVDTFFIATNGVNISSDFVDICVELYDNKKFGCNLQISNDYYHLKEHIYNDKLLTKLPFYNKRHKDLDKLQDGRLHFEGNAIINKLEYATKLSLSPTIISKYDFDLRTIYLNVNGDIINGCDWSYINQNKHIICNVKFLKKYYNSLPDQTVEFIPQIIENKLEI